MEAGKTNLAAILGEIGYIGRTQIFYFALILFVTFYTGLFSMIYAFTAGDLNYRCYINDCDTINNTSVEYNPKWLEYAVPFDEDTELPEKCSMFLFASDHNVSRDRCDVTDFDERKTIQCDKFVFETEEETILTEFDLTCKDNKWKLTLPGTIHSAGTLINLLMIGYFSDRFGRKIVFIVSALIASTLAIAQTFSPGYWWYLVLKFLEPCLGGGTYTIGMVLSLELVLPQYRTLTGALVFLSASAAKIYLGLGAMWVLNWKTLTLMNYIPNFIVIAYIWLLPESITWLQVKGRYQEIANILLRIIRWNKIEVSPETRDTLINRPDQMIDSDNKSGGGDDEKNKKSFPIVEVFRSPPMMLRILCLGYCWLTNLLIFYGLSLISVGIGGNKFTDFVFVNAMEIPACLLVNLLASQRIGRKTILCGAFLTSGIALIVYTFIPDIYWIKLVLFMIGKFAISMSFCTIYIYTSELVPTNLRQTLIGVCSSFGRIGSLTAPQAPLLETLMKNLSIYIFAGTAIVGALIAFRFPETLNSKLPDTIEEALALGKSHDKKSDELQTS